MKRIFVTLFIALITCSAFAQSQRVQIKNIAVVETMIDEASGAANDINKAEVREIGRCCRECSFLFWGRGHPVTPRSKTCIS